MTRYSRVAIALHWTIALALAFQMALGFGLEGLGKQGFTQFQLHKSIGLLILLLTGVRLAWRLTHRPPPAIETGWQAALARSVHAGLYVFMVGAPLTGWLLVSTAPVKVPTMIFGRIPWPHLSAPDRLFPLFEQSHAVLAWVGIALFLLHCAGAIRHQWFVRDGVMLRVAPGGSLLAAILLFAMVPASWAMGMMFWVPGQSASKDAMTLAQSQPVTSEPGATPAAESNSAASPPVANSAAAASEPEVEQPAPPLRWTVQPGGNLAFSVENGEERIEGAFKGWRADIALTPEDPRGAEIRVVIDTDSASVGDPVQDAMLKGPDFLDAARFPEAVFVAEQVERKSASRFVATGRLRLKGASHPLSIAFSLAGSGSRRHVTGQGSIDRKRYAVGLGDAAETLGQEVTLNFAFDANAN